METREFDIGHILTVVTDRLVSRNGVQGLYDVMSFLHGTPVWTHQLGRAMRDAAPWLRESLPQFYDADGGLALELQAYVGLLDRMIDECAKTEPALHLVVDAWLREVAKRYGERFTLSPIPHADLRARQRRI